MLCARTGPWLFDIKVRVSSSRNKYQHTRLTQGGEGNNELDDEMMNRQDSDARFLELDSPAEEPAVREGSVMICWSRLSWTADGSSFIADIILLFSAGETVAEEQPAEYGAQPSAS